MKVMRYSLELEAYASEWASQVPRKNRNVPIRYDQEGVLIGENDKTFMSNKPITNHNAPKIAHDSVYEWLKQGKHFDDSDVSNFEWVRETSSYT